MVVASSIDHAKTEHREQSENWDREHPGNLRADTEGQSRNHQHDQRRSQPANAPRTADSGSSAWESSLSPSCLAAGHGILHLTHRSLKDVPDEEPN